MANKKIKPTTPGRRFYIKQDFSTITHNKPEKSLLTPLKRSGGRNHTGKMTAKHRGGGHKKQYRVIDFKRKRDNVPAVVSSIQYDPNRTARIALLYYKDGHKAYIIAPDELKEGSEIISGEKVAPEVGNSMPLKNIPIGTMVHCIELHPGRGAALARSAGTYAQLTAREGKYAQLKLPSGDKRLVLITCRATIGTVSNAQHKNTRLGKAGRNRWLGRRSRTRAVAKNPADHGMGGGEGKASGGQPRSKAGLKAKGKKTRKLNKYSDKYITKK
ncbi:MAG: 50S ribosomal protein L2 [Bacteroidota bacterium]